MNSSDSGRPVTIHHLGKGYGMNGCTIKTALDSNLISFQNLFSLYSRLADHNIGMIDWEPYIPKFFTRFQKNFNLPVMYKGTNVGEHYFPFRHKPSFLNTNPFQATNR